MVYWDNEVDALKNKFREILIVALFTAFMGQVHFYPFGTDFRITVGVIVFTFLMLHFHSLPIVATSVVTGISVLSMRMGIDVFANSLRLGTAFYRHLPAVMYYVSYGIIIDKKSFRRLFYKPVYFIITLTTADIASNFFELLIRNQFRTSLFESIFSMIIVTASLRSCIVLALSWTIKNYNQFITNEEHQKRYKELLLLTAKLKSEIFFLKKSMQDIEGAMAKSYGIYNTIKENGSMEKQELEGIVTDCLTLSIDIHEIKKDYNRIVVSMEKLMPADNVYKAMKLSEIFETIGDIFTGYLAMLGKEIKIIFDLKKDGRTHEYFIVMSILNNLIQNSVEACFRSDSYIKISCMREEESLIFHIEDNGMGIREKERNLIFTPGHTTKFNPDTGQVSTGLGLTHIKMLTEHLGGRITLQDREDATVFKLEYPINTIMCEEDTDE